MATRQKKNSPFLVVIFPVTCLLLTAYFSHHAINGRFGYHAQAEAQDEALHLEFRLAELRRDREVLAHRVSLLKPGSIEKDMLDEQVRYHLNLVDPDEIVIMRN